jgi:hypothetical protein
MKTKFISFTAALAVVLPSFVSAQPTDAQIRSQQPEIQSIQAGQSIPSQSASGVGQQGSSSVGSTDSGMQRPVFIDTGFFSFFAGIDNSLSRKQNPLLLTTDADIKTAGGHDFTWSKTFSAGTMTNPIDMDSFMLMIVAGGAWTKTDHLITEFEALDDFANSAYLLFMLQHETGWNYRIGSSYAMMQDSTRESETYSEFYPNIGASKSFDLPLDLIGLFDISGGKHLTTSDSITTTDTKTMDNWDFAVSLGLKYQLFDLILSPTYRYSKKIYSTDNTLALNKDRIDYGNTLSFKVDYPVYDHINLSLGYSFDQRDSTDTTKKYKAWNADANFGLSMNF